jgi:hypothetical protein
MIETTALRYPWGSLDTMPRFHIEVPHEPETVACARAVDVFLKSGSHFLTHADWGCKDGVHKAWFVAEVGSKEEARAIVPVAFRAKAEIVQLNCFTIEEIDKLLRYHRDPHSPGKIEP